METIRKKAIKENAIKKYGEVLQSVFGVTEPMASKAKFAFPEEQLSRDFWINAPKSVSDNDSFFKWRDKQLDDLESFLKELALARLQSSTLESSALTASNGLDVFIRDIDHFKIADDVLPNPKDWRTELLKWRKYYEEHYETLSEQHSELSAAFNDLEELEDFEAYEAW